MGFQPTSMRLPDAWVTIADRLRDHHIKHGTFEALGNVTVTRAMILRMALHTGLKKMQKKAADEDPAMRFTYAAEKQGGE